MFWSVPWCFTCFVIALCSAETWDEYSDYTEASPCAEKRKPLTEAQNSPLKKTKLESDENNSDFDNSLNSTESNKPQSNVLTGETNTTGLTSWQKKRMEENRIKAKLKLLSKQLPIIDPEMGLTWFTALESEFQKPYFKELNDFVMKERQTKTIYPPEKDVWAWTKQCDIEEVKVVILGQDPYHGPGQAHGLCFSVPVGVTRPPSLINIFKEVRKNVKDEDYDKVEHGYLQGWAVQGVLLLNAVLTVEARKANSHKDCGWEKFTTAVIKHLSDRYERIVFLLWGANAQKKAEVVDPVKHLLLKAVHPSPLSAHRGFFGCRHFLQCNKYLEKHNKIPIDWYWLPDEEIVLPVPTSPPIPMPWHTEKK